MENKLLTYVLLLCCFFVCSCKNDESNSVGTGTTAPTNIIAGQIENWNGGSDKIIRPINYTNIDSSWLGSSPITSDGKFSITLGIPPDNMMGSITQGISTGVNVSDSTAKSGGKFESLAVLQFEASTSTYNNVGHVIRISSTTVTWFTYVNKNVTIIGNSSGRTFNINFVKGWNMYSVSGSSGSFSSIEPSDTKWVYDP